MVYDRRVRYLDYYRNGERIKGGGFARTEINGDLFKLELTLKGILASGGKTAEVILTDQGGETVLGQVRIENGGGSFRYQGNLKRDFPGRELRAGELTGIRVPLGEGVQAACSWPAENGDAGAVKGRKTAGREREEKHRFEEGPRPERQAERRGTEALQPEGEDKFPLQGRRVESRKGEPSQPEGQVQERKEESLWESAERSETERLSAEERPGNDGTGAEPEGQREEQREKQREDQETKEPSGSPKRRPVKLLEDKWRQLSAIYPHIRPFRDERDYLSLGPADFVLFSEESYRAVNNSFLLHGYYNYRHLILTRMERRGEVVYYLGVPGTYFDREKQVAVMFGFESFECAEEPAQEGDFGYYMMKVSL